MELGYKVEESLSYTMAILFVCNRIVFVRKNLYPFIIAYFMQKVNGKNAYFKVILRFGYWWAAPLRGLLDKSHWVKDAIEFI